MTTLTFVFASLALCVTTVFAWVTGSFTWTGYVASLGLIIAVALLVTFVGAYRKPQPQKD
jgi:FtsH-binding integral membrane protein